MEALESLNGFQSSVELFVTAFDDVRGLGAAIVKELLRFHVACKQITVVEDVVERGDFHRIIVVPWCSPANVTLKIRLAECRKIEDFLFEVIDKFSVRFVASHFQGFADVLQEVDMAELDDDAGVHLTRCHANGFVVIADDSKEFVTGVLELREELHQRREVLRRCKQADRNIMRQVINAVDERNLPVISFYRNKLPVHHEEAAEALGIAVGERDLIVVRQRIQLGHKCSVGGINALPNACSERAGARTFEV